MQQEGETMLPNDQNSIHNGDLGKPERLSIGARPGTIVRLNSGRRLPSGRGQLDTLMPKNIFGFDQNEADLDPEFL